MKTRNLSALFVAAICYSILIISLHHYVDHDGYRDCAICKFADDLSTGDRGSQIQLTTPYSGHVSYDSQNLICILAILAIAVSSRSPPAGYFLDRHSSV